MELYFQKAISIKKTPLLDNSYYIKKLQIKRYTIIYLLAQMDKLLSNPLSYQ